MGQIFKLEISNKTVTKLAGYPYGQQLFDHQAKGKIDFERPFTIVIPPQIDLVASSFIQGFFGEINNIIGVEKIRRNMTIESSIADLKDIVVKSLLSM